MGTFKGRTVNVVSSANSDSGALFIKAIDELCASDSKNKCIAFDCEGVQLSRVGSLEIISICFSTGDIFLIDMGNNPDKDILNALKHVFEDPNVTKIIHDCHMDSDALYHFHGIKLVNLHDTSSFHSIITKQEHINLNDLLGYHGLGINTTRDSSVYKINPSFWAQRPLTQQMIHWASADVDKLIVVAEKQLHHISSNDLICAKLKSDDNNKLYRDRLVESDLKVTGNIGKFFGKQGSNLRALERRTHTMLFMKRDSGTWSIYYQTRADLEKVKHAMRC